MSFDCPYYINGKCILNSIDCTPAKGKCVLKGRYMTASYLIHLKNKEQMKKKDKQ
ncbi:MAG: hypothetical protein JXR46_14635 [Calditrichaceae bacterium]|nr:hypothetical protein [Calditrichaceae bacterium]MBN2710277.1 hypothetical protein [Calditrichaceae bacterium]